MYLLLTYLDVLGFGQCHPNRGFIIRGMELVPRRNGDKLQFPAGTLGIEFLAEVDEGFPDTGSANLVG